jgi:hypothetical protein
MAEEEESGRGRGCCLAGGIGCLVLVIGTVVGSVMLWSWLSEPAPIVPAEHYPGQDTRAFMVVHMRPEHADYLARAGTVVQQAPVQGQQGEWARKLARAVPMRRMLPVQLTMVVQPGPEGEFNVNYVISMSRYLRLVTWMMRRGAKKSSQTVTWLDEDVPVLRTDRRYMLAPLENSMFITVDTPLAANWLERHRAALGDVPAEEEPPVPELDAAPRLVAAYQRVSRDAMVVFASLNQEGELRYLLEGMETDLKPEEQEALLAVIDAVQSVAGQINPAEGNTGRLTMFVETPDEESSEAARRVLEQLAAERQRFRDLAFETGEGYQGSVLLTVEATIDEWFRRTLTGAQDAGDEPGPGASLRETPAQPNQAPEGTP